MNLKSVYSLVLALLFIFTAFVGCAKDKTDVNSISSAQVETAIENTVAEGTDGQGEIFCGDYSVVSSQIHLPNQEIDGDFSANSNGAPLKEGKEEIYTTSTLTSAETESANTNLKDGYTLTYGCVATRVTGKNKIDKMKSFLEETCKYWCLVDWVKKPTAICTVELGNNRYSLVENYMVENLESGGGAYVLNRTELEAFRGILKKDEVLSDSIDASIDKVIENLVETEPLSGTPKDDAADEHTHAPSKKPKTVSDPIKGFCGNIITKLEKDGVVRFIESDDSVTLTALVINLDYSEPMCKCATEFSVYVETEKEPYEVNLSQNFIRFQGKHASLTADQTETVRKIVNHYFSEDEIREINVNKPKNEAVSSKSKWEH